MNVQIIHGEELTESPPQTLPCIQSRALPSIFERFAPSVKTLPAILLGLYVPRFGHRPRFPEHVPPPPRQRRLDEILFSSNINGLATVNAGADPGGLPLPCFIFQKPRNLQFPDIKYLVSIFFMNVAIEHGLEPCMLSFISKFASTMCQNKRFRFRFFKKFLGSG